MIKINGGATRFVHVDQLRKHYDQAEVPNPVLVESSEMEIPNPGFNDQVSALGQSDSALGQSDNMPSEGMSDSDVQPDPVPVAAPDPVCTTPAVRRSSRARKPVEKLNL